MGTVRLMLSRSLEIALSESEKAVSPTNHGRSRRSPEGVIWGVGSTENPGYKRRDPIILSTA